MLAGPFPVVVFWGFNHFLVIEGVSDGKVHLNDPAVGPRTVTLKEFSDKFTGVVLEFDPGPDFVRERRRLDADLPAGQAAHRVRSRRSPSSSGSA